VSSLNFKATTCTYVKVLPENVPETVKYNLEFLEIGATNC
jgi:hypothetical protein